MAACRRDISAFVCFESLSGNKHPVATNQRAGWKKGEQYGSGKDNATERLFMEIKPSLLRKIKYPLGNASRHSVVGLKTMNYESCKAYNSLISVVTLKR